jgi:hypothetical protein
MTNILKGIQYQFYLIPTSRCIKLTVEQEINFL